MLFCSSLQAHFSFIERNNFQETHVVTFKPNRRDKRRPVKDWGRALREQLLEDDVDMGGTSGPARVFDKNKMGRKGNRSGSPAILQKRKLLESPSGWYRVTVSCLTLRKCKIDGCIGFHSCLMEISMTKAIYCVPYWKI